MATPWGRRYWLLRASEVACKGPQFGEGRQRRFSFFRLERDSGSTQAQTVARSLSSGLTDTPSDPEKSTFWGSPFMRSRKGDPTDRRLKVSARSSEAHRAGKDHAHAKARGRDEKLLKQLVLLVLRHDCFLPDPPTESANEKVRLPGRNGKFFRTASRHSHARRVRKRTAASLSRPLSRQHGFGLRERLSGATATGRDQACQADQRRGA